MDILNSTLRFSDNLPQAMSPTDSKVLVWQHYVIDYFNVNAIFVTTQHFYQFWSNYNMPLKYFSRPIDTYLKIIHKSFC